MGIELGKLASELNARDSALTEIIDEMFEKEAKKGWLKKGAKKVYSLLKKVGEPAVIGAGFGYLSGGVEGAQQGAVVGASFGGFFIGGKLLFSYFSGKEKDEEKKKKKMAENLKDYLEFTENDKAPWVALAVPLVGAGLYAGLGWIGGAPVGLATKIGGMEGLLGVGRMYRAGRLLTKKIDTRLEERRVERMEGPYVDVDALRAL